MKGYKTHGFAGLLGLKGALAVCGMGVDGEAVELKPVTTFENFDEQLRAAKQQGDPMQQGTTDLLLAGAISSMRSAIERKKNV